MDPARGLLDDDFLWLRQRFTRVFNLNPEFECQIHLVFHGVSFDNAVEMPDMNDPIYEVTN